MGIMREDYIYAVARIRCVEGKLLSQKEIERMLSAKNNDEILAILAEREWDTSSSDMFLSENNKLWRLIDEISYDKSVFDFLRIKYDFQNLKAAIKAYYTESESDSLFVHSGTVDPMLIKLSVRENNYSILPIFLESAGKDATKALLYTSDGQQCDFIVDKAYLEAMNSINKTSKEPIIKDYCKTIVAVADIKTAVRCALLSKSAGFIQKTLTSCDVLDVKVLAQSASKGADEVCTYLMTTEYKASVPAIKAGISVFEKWCDNFIMNTMKQYKTDPFTIAPIVAYIVAKQTEIDMVRFIFMGRTNGINDTLMRERIRNLYV